MNEIRDKYFVTLLPVHFSGTVSISFSRLSKDDLRCWIFFHILKLTNFVCSREPKSVKIRVAVSADFFYGSSFSVNSW